MGRRWSCAWTTPSGALRGADERLGPRGPAPTIPHRLSTPRRGAQRASRDCDGITTPEARPGAPGSIQRRRARVSLSILGVSCRRGQFRPGARRRSLSVDLNGCPDMLRFRGKGGPVLMSVSSRDHGSSCWTTEIAASVAIHSDSLSSWWRSIRTRFRLSRRNVSSSSCSRRAASDKRKVEERTVPRRWLRQRRLFTGVGPPRRTGRFFGGPMPM